MQQPFYDVDEIYNQKLGEVLYFFASRLQRYYSSSLLTLLLTSLDIPPHLRLINTVFQANTIPLPSGLRAMDSDFLSFSSVSHLLAVDWNIFRDFLDSGHPLALDGKRHATAASACLKLIFTCYQVPLSSFRRFSRHSLTPRLSVYKEHFSHRHNVHRVWRNFLRPYLSTHMCRGIPGIYIALDLHQRTRAIHLRFLLEKSAYSDSLLTFTRRRVFRFGYLQRNHPTYMKKAIFALAKYIHRVTGETAEVRACKSIWGRNGWFSAD